jgi:hypothetical protein
MVGVNTPPTAPEATVAAVARILASRTQSTSPTPRAARPRLRLPLDVEKDVVAVAASSNGIYFGAKNAQSIGLVSFYDSVDFQKSSEVEAKPRAAENWRLPLRSSEWLLEDESG